MKSSILFRTLALSAFLISSGAGSALAFQDKAPMPDFYRGGAGSPAVMDNPTVPATAHSEITISKWMTGFFILSICGVPIYATLVTGLKKPEARPILAADQKSEHRRAA
jgi:hypothetical protein